jgi:hypothetical protein
MASMESMQEGKRSSSGYGDSVNKGTGLTKSGAGKSQSMKAFHERPASEKGTEFSLVKDSGDGYSK